MSGRIPEHAIAEVRDRADILRVVERHVKLKKSGRNWSGLCPFHADKDPSFTVNQERRMFHCFGCGKGGDVFRFVMELEGKSFPDAVRDVAEQFGVTLPEREMTPDEGTYTPWDDKQCPECIEIEDFQRRAAYLARLG